MGKRIKKYKEISATDFLLLRENLFLKRYRKTRARDSEKKRILLNLAMKKIKEQEKEDFIPIGYKRRKLRMM